MSRRFNTAGPCDPVRHYMVPPEPRFPEARELIDQQGYFVLHAPRQTGKTTTLRALAKALTAEGRYAALHFTCEEASVTGDDYGAGMRAILFAIRTAAEHGLPAELQPPPFPEAPAEQLLGAALGAWAHVCPRPLVLFFDEIDSMVGNTVIGVLRQLRAGFPERPAHFPWSVVLCGMRDVRDYKLASGGSPPRLGSASPFNVKVRSSRLGDFSFDDVRALYAQHTSDTGQPFEDAALARAFELSAGQPWLVNALAREVVDVMKVPPTEAVTAAHIEAAKERLILARSTHLDSLLARLREERVQRVLEPILAGDLPEDDPYDDDYQYTTDLGLIAPSSPPRIANPIYREVILRVLATTAERSMEIDRKSYVGPDGQLDCRKVLEGFADFWRENGDVLVTRMPYAEVAPQLVLMAWLHGVVNGEGLIEREVGIGRKRIDVLVRRPFAGGVQREALELKVWRDRDKRGDPTAKGLVQLDEYLAKLGLDAGTLVVFDARAGAAPIEDRTRFEARTTGSGRKVTLLLA